MQSNFLQMYKGVVLEGGGPIEPAPFLKLFPFKYEKNVLRHSVLLLL